MSTRFFVVISKTLKSLSLELTENKLHDKVKQVCEQSECFLLACRHEMFKPNYDTT